MTRKNRSCPAFSVYKPIVLFLSILVFSGLACARTQAGADEPFWSISRAGLPTEARGGVPTPTIAPWISGPRRTPGAPILTPTPDAPHPQPTLRTSAEEYVIQPGDSLGAIAARYGVGIHLIVEENQLSDPNLLSVGQMLIIPAPPPQPPGPGYKIIPDSELVYGPYSMGFDVKAFIQSQRGFLAGYTEEVEDQTLDGAEIVARIAREYSVNPRLLLAVLQHASGWVTNPNPPRSGRTYPMGWADTNRKGLFRQLSWAANSLNRGYYLWKARSAPAWVLANGDVVPASPTINAGTAAVQQLYAQLYDRDRWEEAVTENGLAATFNALFGYPFDYAIDPLIPGDLFQPEMALPFEPGATWYYTGGPHGGWGDGSAWAALDFAPPGEALGCVQNDAWVTAVADGQILRAENGAVIQDLDGDGLEGTGWIVLYMHVETRDRVPAGTFVRTGDRIGHPSCEGGVSSGTHLHLARRYNGEWISAAGGLPFVLDGWVAKGTENEYDGYLARSGRQIEAYAGINNNGIIR